MSPTDTQTDHATPSVKNRPHLAVAVVIQPNSLISTLLPNGNNFEVTVDFVEATFQCFSVKGEGKGRILI